jgi:hypothetical protein
MAKKGTKIRDIWEVIAVADDVGRWLLRREREVCAHPDGTEYLGAWEYLLLTDFSAAEPKCRTYRTRAAAVAAVQAHCGHLPEALRPKTGTVWAVVAQDCVPGSAKVLSRHKTKNAAERALGRWVRAWGWEGGRGIGTVVQATASCRIGYPLPIG